MLGLANAVGYHRHGGLLELNGGRVWMSHLSPTCNKGHVVKNTVQFIGFYFGGMTTSTFVRLSCEQFYLES